MAENAQDLAGADQSRSATKNKLDGGLNVTDQVMVEISDGEGDDDSEWDNIYAEGIKQEGVDDAYSKPSAVEQELGSGAAQPAHGQSTVTGAEVKKEVDTHMAERPSEGGGTLPLAPQGEHVQTHKAQDVERTEDGLPAAMIDQGDELVADEDVNMLSTDEASTRMIAETSQLESNVNATQPSRRSSYEDDEDPEFERERKRVHANSRDYQNAGIEQPTLHHVDDPESAEVAPTDQVDHNMNDVGDADHNEFVEAARANRAVANAEFEFDSDTIDNSDSDDSSDMSTDSDDGAQPMSAEMIEEMLRKGDGEDDDGSKAGGQAPRTANEQQDKAPPKKSITITKDTKTTFLGNVDKYVEGILLIIGETESKYNVLETNSALCNESRDNIGVTSDVMGSAIKPMYTLHVSEEEVKDFNLSAGAKIYYVNDHSTFVFIKDLQAQKHTDASNMHDEEVGLDEMDFSDDEKEAEYKSANKQNKKAGLGKLTRGAFERGDHKADKNGQDIGARSDARSGPSDRGGGRGRGTPRGAPRGGHRGGMPMRDELPTRGGPFKPTIFNSDGAKTAATPVLNYDDEPVASTQPLDPVEGYNVLKRPDNYAEAMNAAPSASTETLNARGGGGKARGSNDRGAFQGGRGASQGNRGAHNGTRGAHNGNRGGQNNRGGHRGQHSGGEDRAQSYGQQGPQQQAQAPAQFLPQQAHSQWPLQQQIPPPQQAQQQVWPQPQYPPQQQYTPQQQQEYAQWYAQQQWQAYCAQYYAQYGQYPPAQGQ